MKMTMDFMWQNVIRSTGISNIHGMRVAVCIENIGSKEAYHGRI